MTAHDDERGETRSKPPTLRVEPGGRREFYLAELRDVPAKDDIASMSYPLFALRPGDTRVRAYETRRSVVDGAERVEEVRRVTVTPSVAGCATVHDKDVWIYCTSQLVAGLERGRPDALQRRVRFTAYDLLKATRRGTGGKDYQRLLDALERLRGTSVRTDIETGGRAERQGFGLLDRWAVVERGCDHRMTAIEVTLPEWVGRSIEARQVLTLHEAYFGLRSGLERRVYEIARAHCGRQATWQVGVGKLHEKVGSASPIREFRRQLKRLVAAGRLPDYTFKLDARRDVVVVYSRRPPGQLKALKDLLSDA